MSEFASDEAEFEFWCDAVKNASGWASAYYAAQQLPAVCRKLGRENPYPIVIGGGPSPNPGSTTR